MVDIPRFTDLATSEFFPLDTPYAMTDERNNSKGREHKNDCEMDIPAFEAEEVTAEPLSPSVALKTMPVGGKCEGKTKAKVTFDANEHAVESLNPSLSIRNAKIPLVAEVPISVAQSATRTRFMDPIVFDVGVIAQEAEEESATTVSGGYQHHGEGTAVRPGVERLGITHNARSACSIDGTTSFSNSTAGVFSGGGSSNDDDNVVARAELVDDPVVAAEVRMDRTEELVQRLKRNERKQRCVTYSFASLFLVVAIAIAVAVTVLIGGGGEKSSSTSGGSASTFETPPPSAAVAATSTQPTISSPSLQPSPIATSPPTTTPHPSLRPSRDPTTPDPTQRPTGSPTSSDPTLLPSLTTSNPTTPRPSPPPSPVPTPFSIVAPITPPPSPAPTPISTPRPINFGFPTCNSPWGCQIP